MAIHVCGIGVRVSGALLLVALVAAAGATGCGSSRHDALTNAPMTSAGAAAPGGGVGPVTAEAWRRFAERRGKIGHLYFPTVPGAYVDYRVTRLGVGLRYVRVTKGAPEMFFGRMATPLVYDDIPGQVRDSTLYGLRQYFSRAPGGELWFHGAQNDGFMSHTEPPVRQLLAAPTAGEAWADTVLFESFFPGMVLFARTHLLYSWTLSQSARLELPGGVFHALRATSQIDDAPPATLRAPMRLHAAASEPGSTAWNAFVRRGVAPLPEPLKGGWFSRHQGMVALDWPSGQGEVNLNAVTFERTGAGMGPVPPGAPPVVEPGTQ